ncbi:hypothetical protein EUGRSUZ_K01002 [Eucalyptus grandis]|uniref:Uncharacterized protein n=2 Tax=Eucalyptus grandis TaxID=71139 RepID=A0ACC3ISG5_EUCGR|nr:hypothetical protein EUGRSUZ_K01002 [Eucalyptus grandis]
MEHTISIDGSAIWAMRHGRLEDLKTRNPSTPDKQQPFGEGDLNKIMDHDLYEVAEEEEIDKFVDALEKVSQSRKLALSLIFDQVTRSRNSLLHVAASCGREGVMELILFHYPYLVTRKNSAEDTPLHVAVQHGMFCWTQIAQPQDLHNQNKNIDSEIIYWKNKDNKSPLYLAVENCKLSHWKNRKGAVWEILQLLLQESARDEANSIKIQGMSPVLAAIQPGKTGMLKEITYRLPKLLSEPDENGWTPLHWAASLESFEAMELLLRKFPYLALQKDKDGSYPIHVASERPYFAGLKLLMDHTGQNILHVAAETGITYTVQWVLKYYGGPDRLEKLVNSKDEDGNTPLHLASMRNHCKVMRLLTKDKRIDLQHENKGGLTALDLLGRAILIVAGVPRSKGQDVLSPREQGPGASKSSLAKWIKEQVNTLLLVATLVASVTFTVGLTLPGGYNASSDLHPGTATMLHYGMFQVFIIAKMLAMYSSILAVVVLLWGLNRDFYIAELAYHSAGPLLLMALTGMSVAFFAAITVAVSKLIWLKSLVLSIGFLYLIMVVVVLAALIFPSSKTTMRIVNMDPRCTYLGPRCTYLFPCMQLYIFFTFVIVTVRMIKPMRILYSV